MQVAYRTRLVHAAPGEGAAGTAYELGPLRVLVVDSYMDAADSLAELVKLWGHEVRVARTGHEALLDARRYRPDVALVDVVLDGMDGCDFARNLRLDEKMRRTLLIALTTQGDLASRQRTAAAGFFLHLLKPVSPDTLRTILSALANRKKIAR
jgi:two-component system CheB/CheR fusion protein